MVETLGEIKFNSTYLETINCKAATNPRKLAAHAIKNRWTVDRFELEARRATLPDLGTATVAIHSHNSVSDFNPDAISCRLVRNSGVVASAKHRATGETFGYEKWYDTKTLEASDSPVLRDISLLGVYDLLYAKIKGHRYPGRTNTDGFLGAMKEALWTLRAAGGSGMTIHTGLNIFDDAMNKMLLAAYNLQNTTWQEWVLQKTVNDFKTSNLYRLTMTGGYQKVGNDGRLKHGGFTDEKFTHSADTYGKLIGLTRKDLINDDLGALSGIATGLGIEAAQFLEELFYQHLLSRLGTIFPTNGSKNNYISGSTTTLTVDGLTLGYNKFMNQVNADNAPILNGPSMLLTGTTLRVLAQELFTKTTLQVVQTANTKGRPDDNPYVGLFRPVMSAYLDNTLVKQRIASPGAAISGQSATQWLLLASPNAAVGGIVIGSFLNGRTMPTIEQSDAAFDMLGLQWRAYHDAGADDGDPKLGVHSKGAA